MSGIPKIVELNPYFPTGEATVQPVVLWANGKPCYEQFTKHASVGSEIFQSITPVPGHSIVYVLALGAWETYGENRNGDGFPEFPYNEVLSPPWITAADTLPQHYKTFEKYGHNYRHHVNKDPKKAVGRVMKAFWNPSMHRVELLIDLEDAKAPDLAERIASGDFPPVSMGTRVKYDVCTICGNRAPTRKQYCNHLKFQMRDVINGKKVAALNPSPRFFDISWVFRPADATAFMLKKVAEATPYELISGADAGEYIDLMHLQKQGAHKVAVLDKVIQGIPLDAKTDDIDPVELSNLEAMRPMALEAGKNTQDLPDEFLKMLAQFTPPEAFSTTLASGMIRLSTPETIKMMMYRSYPNQEVPTDLLDKAVASQGSVLDLLEEFPQIMDKLEKTGALALGPEFINESLYEQATPYAEKRAGTGEYLKRRFVPSEWRGEATAMSTPLSITDPASGQRYGTTRGAAIRAHDEIAKRNLYKTLGGAALLTGAYKLIGSGLDKTPRHKKLKPLAALALGAVGGTQLPQSMGPHYMTDQGVPVPTLTEMAKTSSAQSVAMPALGTLGVMAALAHDYQSRLRSGVPVGYEHLPLSRRVLDKAEQFSDEHPLVTAGLGTIALNRLGKTGPAQKIMAAGSQAMRPAVETARGLRRGASESLRGLARGEKISSYVADAVSQPDSAVILPAVDLDKIAEWLGWALIEG